MARACTEHLSCLLQQQASKAGGECQALPAGQARAGTRPPVPSLLGLPVALALSTARIAYALLPNAWAAAQVLRWWGFSDEFATEMVFPLTALFFGTGNQVGLGVRSGVAGW